MGSKTSPSPAPTRSKKAPPKFYVLTRSGRVESAGVADQADAVAWCEEGGPWIPAGESKPRKPKLVRWICEHSLCPVSPHRGPCPWSMDAAGIVRCDSMDPIHPGPMLASGDGEDPPMVLETCRIQAGKPFRTISGRLIVGS